MLPILLSIPHGSERVPAELRPRVCITPADLFHDGDAFTEDIYDLNGTVACVVKAAVARAFVDLNRAPDDRPPQNPDGVVKSATCLDRPIYQPGLEPDQVLADQLVARYHAPYHALLEEKNRDPSLALALDCHSMLAAAPPISATPGRPRPLFCLSNRNGATAPDELLRALASAISAAFDVSPDAIGLNDPFQGGYITRRYGGGPVPWVQVEMNRSLYLAESWFDAESRRMDRARLTELRDRFGRALHRLGL